MSDWIEWNGGEKEPDGCISKVRFADGFEMHYAPSLRWAKEGLGGDIIAYKLAEPEQDLSPDMVNHPPHYTAGGIECIEAIRAALTPDEFRGHCKANAMKYIWREAHKGQDESIRKAIWYLEEMLK